MKKKQGKKRRSVAENQRRLTSQATLPTYILCFLLSFFSPSSFSDLPFSAETHSRACPVLESSRTRITLEQSLTASVLVRLACLRQFRHGRTDAMCPFPFPCPTPKAARARVPRCPVPLQAGRPSATPPPPPYLSVLLYRTHGWVCVCRSVGTQAHITTTAPGPYPAAMQPGPCWWAAGAMHGRVARIPWGSIARCCHCPGWTGPDLTSAGERRADGSCVVGARGARTVRYALHKMW